MTEAPYARRLQRELLRLRKAGAFTPQEVPGVRDVFRYQFRAAGWPIVVDLDSTVLEIRAYRDNDTIAVGPVTATVMSMLLGRLPLPDDFPQTSAKDAMNDLRTVVREWAEKNARVHMSSPNVARHPDGWNNA